MTTYLFFEVSKEIPKWFQGHDSEQYKVDIVDTWTDKGLFRNYNKNYYWFNIIETDGLVMLEEISAQIPSTVISIDKYTRSYCDSNSFFTYWIDTYEDGNVVYNICSKTPGRLSKFKNKIISQIFEIDKPDIVIQIE